MNKHACSASCPCQQGKDQAIAEKVARRFLQADVEVGRGIFTPQNLKIHRYRESVEVTDMTNAGKRGKKVSVMHVSVGSMASNMVDVALKNLTSEILHMNYAAAKNHVEKVIAQQKAERIFDGFRLDETMLRGVDVEPMGTTVTIKNKFPDGGWLSIEASPHNFHVIDSAFINAPGKAAHGFHQDTTYWPVKKVDGVTFYGWVKDNLSKLHGMDMKGLLDVWNQLGVQFKSH